MQKRIKNFTMYYEDTGGDGIPILFIHGYPLSSRLWGPQIEALAGAARVIAPDLRGHGRSEPVAGPYWMDLLAEDCAELLDAIGVDEPVVLCGLSMGGYVSFAFYRQYGVRVRGLVLAATRAGEDSEAGKQARDQAAQKAREQGVAKVVEDMLPKMMAPSTYEERPELVEQVRRIMLETSVAGATGDLQGMKARIDSTNTLRQIDLPTLILHGEDDQLIPASEAQAMAAAINENSAENAILELIPKAGHLLNLEQPERFNEAVLRYLKRIS